MIAEEFCRESKGFFRNPTCLVQPTATLLPGVLQVDTVLRSRYRQDGQKPLAPAKCAMFADLVLTIGWVLSVLILVPGPVLLLRIRYGAAWRWIGIGIASWVLALIGKVGLDAGLGCAGLYDQSAMVQGIVGGLNSAIWELGMAAVFLRGRSLSTPNVLAFGVGIGAFEVLFVIAIGLLSLLGDEGVAAGDHATMAAELGLLFFVLERGITLVGHVASRVLVYVALRHRALLPLAVALATFSIVDGVASYGWAAGWDWEDSATLGILYLFLIAVGAIEVAGAWWFWRKIWPTNDTGRRSGGASG